MKKQKGINMEETFKQGLGGGILGAFVGAPGLGMTLGVLHANKSLIKDGAKTVDKHFVAKPGNTIMSKTNTKTKVCGRCGYTVNACKCNKRAMDNPAAWLR